VNRVTIFGCFHASDTKIVDQKSENSITQVYDKIQAFFQRLHKLPMIAQFFRNEDLERI
jgi:hypothetical protein